MKPILRNIFLLFGLSCIIFLLYKFRLDFFNLHLEWNKIILFLPLILIVWVFVYAFNAGAFSIIVNNGKTNKQISFIHSYKLIITGFAFSYTTPFGFGGTPYRVMELKSYIGTPKAISCSFLYSMIHILSHFLLWNTGSLLFILFYSNKINNYILIFLILFGLITLFLFYFFVYGYKKGFIKRIFVFLNKIPLLRELFYKIYSNYENKIEEIDNNISYLHNQSKKFYTALFLDYLGRIVNGFEFYLIFMAINLPITIPDAIILLAFSSLIGNLFFFLPMQLGAREGGLLIIIELLGLGALSIGVFSSFYVRVRELCWIIIGVLLIKVGTKNIMK